MHALLRLALRGAAVLLPLIVTVWAVWSALFWLDSLGIQILHWSKIPLPEWPGLGLLLMLTGMLISGLLFEFNPISWLFQHLEDWLLRFPVIKTLYGAVKDFASMFDGQKKKSQPVVLVNMPDKGLVVGFITSTEIPPAVQQAVPDPTLVAVYLPMSYMVGGYTVFLPEQQLIRVDWSFEEAMRFALTAGVSQSQSRQQRQSNVDKSDLNLTPESGQAR